MNSFVLCGLVLAVIACQALGDGSADVENSWYGKQEAACLSKGGLCITQSQCTKRVGRKGELCPQQAALGFQCCFGLPKNEKRCRMHGGECVKKGDCSPKVLYGQASDCGADQDCCILV